MSPTSHGAAAQPTEVHRPPTYLAALPNVTLLVDRDGRITWAAGGHDRGLVKRLEGRRFPELLTEDPDGLVAAALRDAWSPGLAHNIPLTWTPTPARKAHAIATIAPYGEPGHRAVLVSLVDTTAPTEELARLRRIEGLMTEIERVANVGIWDWDPREPQATWSAQLYRIYGLEPHSHVPSYQDYLTRVHPDDRERIMRATESVFRDHQSYSHDERIFRPDGTMRHLHTWAHAVLDDDGNLVRLVGVCQDVTERVLAEQEVAAAARRVAASEKLSALGTLVSGVGHEIRTPLTYIAANVHLIQKDLERLAVHDPATRASLERRTAAVRDGIRRIERLVTQLRRFVKPQISRVDAGLHDVVSEAIDLFVTTRRGGAVVKTELEPTPPMRLDAAQVQQVVLNLLHNAADVSPAGAAIVVRTRPLPGGGEITVTDSGPGIPAEAKPRVFDPFFTTKPEGTGLGLSISRRIVEAHGGTIQFETPDGGGTMFTVRLPSARQEAEA